MLLFPDRIRCLLLGLLSANLTGGCGLVAPAVQGLAKSQNTPVVDIAAAKASSDLDYLKTLKPQTGGPGLIVFESVAPEPQLADWGAGASRWLQLHIGGQGMFGQTPTFSNLEATRRRFKLDNLRVDAKQGREIARTLGATHYVCSSLDGSAEHATWKLQLRDVAANKLQSDWTLTGTTAQFSSQLPGIGRKLAMQLGAKSPQLPQEVTLSSDELALLGHPALSLSFRQTLASKDSDAIKRLLPKDALAGVLAERIADLDGKERSSIASVLKQIAPANTLVWEHIADGDASRLASSYASFNALSNKYPRNYALAVAQTDFEFTNSKPAREVAWAERSVKSAPGNPWPWRTLSSALGRLANETRQGEFWSKLSAQQKDQVAAIYPRAEAAALKAVELDGKNSLFWSRLGGTAMFNSDEATATAALEKALELDSGNGLAWSLGIDMTQPKWFGSPDKFIAFARRAAENADKYELDAKDLFYACKETKHQADFRPLLETILQKDPRNESALSQLAIGYHYEDRNVPKAEEIYRQLLTVNPDNPSANGGLGNLALFAHHDLVSAKAYFLKAIAVAPKDGYHHANLARFYVKVGNQAQAVAEAQQAKALGFDDATSRVWAETGVAPPQ